MIAPVEQTPSRGEYFTQNLLEKKIIEDTPVHILQPPELRGEMASWNARVKLNLVGGGDAYVGLHIKKKEGKPVAGDWGSMIHIPIHDEQRALGDLVVLMGIDGLSSDNQEKHRKEVEEHKDKLVKLDPEAPWDYPDGVIANHQRKFFDSYHFSEFVSFARKAIIETHSDSIKPNIRDSSGGLKDLPDSISMKLFQEQTLHNIDFYQEIGKIYGYYHSVIKWNFRAPHGQLVFYIPDKQYTGKWEVPGREKTILAARFQSLADVLALPSGLSPQWNNTDGNSNLLTDKLIDELRDLKGANGTPVYNSEQISALLAEKLDKNFSGFPTTYSDLYPFHKLAGLTIRYPITEYLLCDGGSVSTDGIATKNYRHTSKEYKHMGTINDEAQYILAHPEMEVNTYDEKLTREGYTIDDRMMVALRLHNVDP